MSIRIRVTFTQLPAAVQYITSLHYCTLQCSTSMQTAWWCRVEFEVSIGLPLTKRILKEITLTPCLNRKTSIGSDTISTESRKKIPERRTNADDKIDISKSSAVLVVASIKIQTLPFLYSSADESSGQLVRRCSNFPP